MVEHIVLGIIQGVAEWLPVSSEGLIVLAKTNLFGGAPSFESMIHLALFLHLGTFLAALLYFRRDVGVLLKALFSFHTQTLATRKLLSFLLVSTVISGALGYALIMIVSGLASQFAAQGKIITIGVGCLLLGTAYLELRSKQGGYRKSEDLAWMDSILLGIVQGLAALPGLSRSGLTVSALLLRKVDKEMALKISFLMSLPVVLAGNIVLNFDALQWTLGSAAGLASSFVFGLATIHLLLRLAVAVNFGFFVLLFGVLTILSTVI